MKWTPDKVRRFRATHHLTQKEMGEMLGICAKYVYHLERGTRRPSKILELLLDYVSKEMKKKTKGERKHERGLQTEGE